MKKAFVDDDTVTKYIETFLKVGYIVQIFPLSTRQVAVVAIKIGKQGAHYIGDGLLDSLAGLLVHMQDQDDDLKEKI